MASTPEHSESSNIDRRFKLSRACDRCRRRRIKCDEGHPCKSCSTAHSPCTFDEIGKKSLPHKSKRTTLEERMQQIESFIHALPAGIFVGGGLDDEPRTPQHGPPPPAALGIAPSALSPQDLVNPGQFFGTFPFRSDSYEDATHFQNSPSGPLASSYLYLDDQGATRWQGEMSGFPLLDMLTERDAGSSQRRSESPEESVRHPSPTVASSDAGQTSPSTNGEWFPNRKNVTDPARPHDIWMMIGGVIAPDLMDHLVLLFLKTTYYLMPFAHIPSLLVDYPNPSKWDTSFGCFIVAICCLTSRHVDDIRVRSVPGDPFSAGSQYFDLFLRLRSLPGADRPTLYGVQSVLVAAVYAIGRGRLSKGLALLSEAITLSIDAGLHRSVEHYDHFDPIETEVRKRTFWCVYSWDKQAAVYFGRPPMIRLRDCDVPEPALLDDEYITVEGLGVQPVGKTPLMSAFVATTRLYVIIEGILDVHPVPRASSLANDFLCKASSALSGFRQSKDLKESEALVDEWARLLPQYWAVNGETMASKDVIRITQAERLHCMEHFVRMLIHRYRFSLHVANPGSGNELEKQTSMKLAQRCALQIIAKHLEISSLGLMTYYGVFVIHQLTQAGRTLITVLLECKSDIALTTSSLEALKACVGLLRRFSGRYVCGLRSAELLEETCRLNRIPLQMIDPSVSASMRPAWLRPVRKRVGSRPRGSDAASPAASHPENDILRGLLDTGNRTDHMNHGMDLIASGTYLPQLLTTSGGLVEPLTQGSLAPLTADMFGNEEVGDLLAYFGGGGGGDVASYAFMPSTPLTPMSFASDVVMTSGLSSGAGIPPGM